MKLSRIILVKPISFAGEGHVSDISDGYDIQDLGAVVRIQKGASAVRVPWSNIVVGYEAPAGMLAELIGNHVASKPSLDQKFAHLAPEPEPAHNVTMEAPNAAEKWKEQQDPRGKHPQGNRRR